ncbi:hypothetical protein B296_00054742 [Ensete ventricosum]|uniref:Uncharacterized protein n=1 Tax=Ensete ventricosum TaxID=4639 RepID=A0A426X2C0_ENSVE|nr:hypothetical protein B296_00054742 [Ensete ventricosum]
MLDLLHLLYPDLEYTLGDHWKKTGRLAVRISEAVGFTGDADLEPTIMNMKKVADDSARAKFDNPIRSHYHALARSSSCEGRRS